MKWKIPEFLEKICEAFKTTPSLHPFSTSIARFPSPPLHCSLSTPTQSSPRQYFSVLINPKPSPLCTYNHLTPCQLSTPYPTRPTTSPELPANSTTHPAQSLHALHYTCIACQPTCPCPYSHALITHFYKIVTILYNL